MFRTKSKTTLQVSTTFSYAILRITLECSGEIQIKENQQISHLNLEGYRPTPSVPRVVGVT